jgi:hypothetical protein
MLIEDIVDEAMKVRDGSRILKGAFAWNVMVLLGMAADGKVSQDDYLEVIRRAFALGYIAVKRRDDIRFQDSVSGDKIGSLNDEFDNEQMEFCFRMSLVFEEDVLRNEPSDFLSKHRFAEDILKVLSQELHGINIVTDDFLSTRTIAKDIQGEFASKCASAFVLGYVAAKHPKRFK